MNLTLIWRIVLMNTFFSIVFSVLLIFSIYKLRKNKESKMYKILIGVSIFILLLSLPLPFKRSIAFSVIFLVLLIFSIYKLRENKENKMYKIFTFASAVLLITSLLLIGSSNNDTKDTKSEKSSASDKKKSASIDNLSKKDVDKMSDSERMDYILNIDEKGEKLYKKNKDTYKYLYKKYFDKDYDSVTIPNKETIENMEDTQNLPTEKSTKLELEDPETYDVYLSKYSKSESEKFEEDEEDNDNSYDEEELKEDIRSELNDRATIKDVNYFNDSLGKNAVIVIKGKENLSDKMTSDGMRFAVADVVKGVKNSDVDLDTFTVDVVYPVTAGDSDNSNDEHVIKSEWSMDTVQNMSKEELELLNTQLDDYATSYSESNALK